MNTSDFVSFWVWQIDANYGLRLWRLRSQPRLPSAQLAPHVCASQSNCTKSSRPPAITYTWYRLQQQGRSRQFSNKHIYFYCSPKRCGILQCWGTEMLWISRSFQKSRLCVHWVHVQWHATGCNRLCLYINDMSHLGNNRQVEAFSRRSDSVKCQIWQRWPFNYENKKWLKWPEMIETTTALKLKLFKWFSNDPISVCIQVHLLQDSQASKNG